MHDVINNQITIEEYIDKVHLPEDGNVYNAVTQIPHLICEIGEFMLADTRWKKSECEKLMIPKKEAMEELTDILLMTIDLMLSYGMTEEDIIAAYNHKLDVLEKRHNIPKGELVHLT